MRTNTSTIEQGDMEEVQVCACTLAGNDDHFFAKCEENDEIYFISMHG